MIKRAAAIAFSVLLLVSLLITGCWPAPATPSTPVTPATEGEVLNLYGVDPLTLDPAVSGDMTSHEYITQIYNGLLRLGDDLEPVPDIAREWQVSKDGTTYTFSLLFSPG